MKTVLSAVVIVVVGFGLLSVSSAKSGHVMVTPGDLEWVDLASLPAGAKLTVIEGPMDKEGPFTARIKFPPNYELPAHWHPVIERVTVISGTFHMGMGDKLDKKKTKPLTPGSVMIIQPKNTHFAWTEGEAIVQLNGEGPWGIVYVDPKDDPRKK